MLDFQEWIDSHGEYARSLLPGISSPKGMLIIGRSTKLTIRQKRKLHMFNLSNSMVNVLTFDDVLNQTQHLYDNIHRVTKSRV